MLLIWAGTQVQGPPELHAATRRYRATWRSDPATSMVIGFEHTGTSSVRLLYDLTDHGNDASRYRFSAAPSRTVNSHGMRNCFVRLTQLRPATVYYFVVVDADGSSRRMSFETPPNRPGVPLSIIAGGDSRNNAEVARRANRLVAKLRPHFVLFGGDMTNSDTDREWMSWLDDWQLTMSSDGRLTPIVPARGNHERDNATIYNLFDVPAPDVYYALTFGGNLLTVYTLNTLHPPAGDQLAWLRGALTTSRSRWKIAQYHQAMRPHTSFKKERNELVEHWGKLFYTFGVNLVVESDAHVVKQTYPIRPSNEAGSSQGFIRDDANGTVYTGEGCWGAPLRNNDDDKPWTRASGRFNQFKWIWVQPADVQVRTVVIDRSANVTAEVSPAARLTSPPGMYYWEADRGGDVLRILPRGQAVGGNTGGSPPTRLNPAPAAPTPTELTVNARNEVTVPFQMTEGGQPVFLLAAGSGRNLRVLQQFPLSARGPGPYTETFRLPPLPRGEPVELVLKVGQRVIKKFSLR